MNLLMCSTVETSPCPENMVKSGSLYLWATTVDHTQLDMEFCTSGSTALASNQTDPSSPQQSWMPSQSADHQLMLLAALVESSARLPMLGLIGWRLVEHHLITMTILHCLLARLLLCHLRFIGHIHVMHKTSCKVMEHPGDSIGMRNPI